MFEDLFGKTSTPTAEKGGMFEGLFTPHVSPKPKTEREIKLEQIQREAQEKIKEAEKLATPLGLLFQMPKALYDWAYKKGVEYVEAPEDPVKKVVREVKETVPHIPKALDEAVDAHITAFTQAFLPTRLILGISDRFDLDTKKLAAPRANKVA